MMLQTIKAKFHIVREGQTVENIAQYYCVSPYWLVRENGLKAQPHIGQILKIPEIYGNRYIVREGDTKALLCGSEEGYFQKNGTDIFYIGMCVLI